MTRPVKVRHSIGLAGRNPETNKADMANIKSQKKRNRQTIVRTERNRALRSEFKTRTRNALEAADSGDQAAADDALRIAQKKIDVAVTKGILKKNTAARRKSTLTRQVRQKLS